MPLLYQQNKTPSQSEATWGIRILVIWNKAAREQIITNSPSRLESIKQDLSPAAIWNFKTQAPYLLLNRQLKGCCRKWQKYVGSPKTQETQWLMQVLTTPPITQLRKWISVYWSWSVPPSIQQNHHSKSWRDKYKQTINRAELAGIAAALINEHAHIATDSAGALWQIRNSILYPQCMKRHKHVKLLETIIHRIYWYKDTIHLYKLKAHAGILGKECADTVAKCSVENQSGHDIHINTDTHPHPRSSISWSAREGDPPPACLPDILNTCQPGLQQKAPFHQITML